MKRKKLDWCCLLTTDGSRVIAAVGNRVLLYKADNGDLIDSLRGHKDTVYSVSFSCDGTRFSSGKNLSIGD